MSLDEIIEQTSIGQRVFADWSVLKNLYFKGQNSLAQLEAWAYKHDIKVLKTDIESESFNSIKFKTVMFLPKKKGG